MQAAQSRTSIGARDIIMCAAFRRYDGKLDRLARLRRRDHIFLEVPNNEETWRLGAGVGIGDLPIDRWHVMQPAVAHARVA